MEPLPLGQVGGGGHQTSICLYPFSPSYPGPHSVPQTHAAPKPAYNPPFLLFLAPAASCKHPVPQTNIQTGSAADFGTGRTAPSSSLGNVSLGKDLAGTGLKGFGSSGAAALEEMWELLVGPGWESPPPNRASSGRGGRPDPEHSVPILGWPRHLPAGAGTAQHRQLRDTGTGPWAQRSVPLSRLTSSSLSSSSG